MTRATPIPDTITIHVPFRIVKRGGRKEVLLPEGTSSWTPPRTRVDNAMVKALARGFRWRKLLEEGVHATVEDIAAAEKINTSYVSRILRLTLLAPATIEAILDGRQGPEVTLGRLLKGFPVEWEGQQPSFHKVE